MPLSTNAGDNATTTARAYNVGAHLKLWETLSKRSKRHKHHDCSSRRFKFKPNSYSVGSLVYLAKEGNIDKYKNFRKSSYRLTDICDDGVEYPCVEIGTPFFAD